MDVKGIGLSAGRPDQGAAVSQPTRQPLERQLPCPDHWCCEVGLGQQFPSDLLLAPDPRISEPGAPCIINLLPGKIANLFPTTKLSWITDSKCLMPNIQELAHSAQYLQSETRSYLSCQMPEEERKEGRKEEIPAEVRRIHTEASLTLRTVLGELSPLSPCLEDSLWKFEKKKACLCHCLPGRTWSLI